MSGNGSKQQNPLEYAAHVDQNTLNRHFLNLERVLTLFDSEVVQLWIFHGPLSRCVNCVLLCDFHPTAPPRRLC
jgi:hypothetical protein